MNEEDNEYEGSGIREPNSDESDLKDAASAAARVLNHRATAVSEEISSCAVLIDGIDRFADQKSERDLFLNPLVESKVLPKADASLLFDGKDSQVSMLRKVAEHKEVILDPRILALMNPGASIYYQVLKLWEDVNFDITRVVSILKKKDGPVTRRFVESERALLQAPAEKSTQNVADSTAGSTSPSPDPDGAKEPKAEVASSIGAVAAVLLTPTKQDVAKLRKDYLAEGTPACLRMEIANKAALIIATKMVDVPALADKLECWGFSRISHVYLLSPPQGPDLTQAEVLAVCERGNARIKGLKDWPETKDAEELANNILGELSGPRTHLFAKNQSPGWNSVVGEENWKLDAKVAG